MAAGTTTTDIARNGNGNQMATSPANDIKITAQAMNAVAKLISSGRLHLPSDYSPENAIKAAELMLPNIKNLNDQHIMIGGKINTAVVTQESVAAALMSMVVQGLNPDKKQCYFIVYGKLLVCQRGYFGDIAVAKRVKPGIGEYYDTVREGEEIKIGKARRPGSFVTVVSDHGMSFPRNPNIVGAYCGFFDVDGNDLGCDIFDVDRIKASWSKSKTYKEGGNGTHNVFTEEMCLRTVIRHRCKPIINSSNDVELLKHVKASDLDAVEADVAAEAAQFANVEMIDVTPHQAQVEGPRGQVEGVEDEDVAKSTVAPRTQEQEDY